ncbi:MAG TPA: hypothetical protein VJN95_00650 [Gemmatimonadales bacterium]|nr:hypothetical protein [Gemmatimonadales bacterium]
MIHHHHSWPGEGLDAGLLGGTTVAVWFLLKDLLAGHPLRTPSILGQLLLSPSRAPIIAPSDFGAVVVYTAAHFLAFVLFGLLASWLIRFGVLHSLARFAMLVLLVVFEFFFFVVTQSFSDSVGQFFPAFWVLSGNLLAAGVMGAYFWRRHPALRRAIGREPLGA